MWVFNTEPLMLRLPRSSPRTPQACLKRVSSGLNSEGGTTNRTILDERLSVSQEHAAPPPYDFMNLMRPLHATGSFSRSKYLVEFAQRQRLLIDQGWPSDMLLGSADIDLDVVLSDSPLEVSPVQVAQWVAVETKSFDSLGFPERLGFIFLITRFLKVREPRITIEERQY
ncbi:hypothetical protein LTR78_010880 [Recurvomyces mirabilis]|uniref:Uncharacterized protein n=1 Tax=Recurvomyces mirabilis TaxID=574656 RepID=A0AAE0TM95_9PEZI|nr:hypothetical protein LTR78_010880 [Recurvomyces mirabilis]KAK5149884.1 hypothetical protein LTS14_010599 [Recurvomyces mirabilis]